MTRRLFIEFAQIEIEANTYYEAIREWCERHNKDLKDIGYKLGYYYYNNCIDAFAPFKFLDGINDYIKRLVEHYNEDKDDIDEIIDGAFDSDFMSMY